MYEGKCLMWINMSPRIRAIQPKRCAFFKTNEAHSVVSRRKITRTLLRDGPQPLRRPLEATARSRNEKMTNVYFRKKRKILPFYRPAKILYRPHWDLTLFSRHIFSTHPKHPHSYLYEACSKGRLVFNTTIRTNLVVPRIRRLRPRTDNF